MPFLRTISLIFALLLNWNACAQIPLTGAGKGAPGGGASYTGPGNITVFTNWYGLRAYSGAYAAGLGNIADIVDTATGAFSCTIKSTSSGDADLTSLSCTGGTLSVTTFCTVTHVAGCSFAKLYDQIGAVDITQATLANMPILVFNVTGGHPIMRFNGSGALFGISGADIAQPFTISGVARRTGSFTTKQMFGGGGGNVGAGWAASANTLDFFAASDVTVGSITDSTFHAMQMIGNGASGNIYVDGASNVLNAGASSFNGTSGIRVGGDAFSENIVGDVGEMGVASAAFGVAGGGTASLVNANQRAYWGF